MKVIKIEYSLDGDDLENTTFELFDNINKAFDFMKKINPDYLKGISLVEVNENNIYYENGGSLNYEDNSSLFI